MIEEGIAFVNESCAPRRIHDTPSVCKASNCARLLSMYDCVYRGHWLDKVIMLYFYCFHDCD
jgi:hypothetical protein